MVTALIIILMKLVEATGFPIDTQMDTLPVSSENIVMPAKVTPACFNFVKPADNKLASNT